MVEVQIAYATSQIGYLAHTFSGKSLPLQVLKSNCGYYIGTADEEGPMSRESTEYFPRQESAAKALSEGDWTQRLYP